MVRKVKVEEDEVELEGERQMEALGRFLGPALVLRFKLVGGKPPLWRRIQAHADSTYDEVRRMAAAILGPGIDVKAQFMKEGVWRELPEGLAGLAEGSRLLLRFPDNDVGVIEVTVASEAPERAYHIPRLLKGSSRLKFADGKFEIVKGSPSMDEHRAVARCRRYDQKAVDDEGVEYEIWQAMALRPEPLLLPPEISLRRGRKEFAPLQPAQNKIPPGVPVDLQIMLEGAKATRTVRVWSEISFFELHFVIIAAMGWSGHHLHEFRVGSSSITDVRDEEALDSAMDTELIDEMSIMLRDIAAGKGWSISHDYDFGDNWRHKVRLLALPSGPPPERPLLLDGHGACPPEDVGGLGGYEEMLRVLRGRNTAERKEYISWLGGTAFDPEAFDAAAAQQRLDHLQRW